MVRDPFRGKYGDGLPHAAGWSKPFLHEGCCPERHDYGRDIYLRYAFRFDSIATFGLDHGIPADRAMAT